MSDTIKPVAWLHIEPNWPPSVEDEPEARKCPQCQPVYTADALHQARDEALEEAAKVCEEWRRGCDNRTMQAEGWAAAECADAIRALKRDQNREG